MKKLDRNKKAFVLLSSYLIILITPKIKAYKNNEEIVYNKEYNICDDNLFATYNNKNIYIGNKEHIKAISNIDSNNIYIIDDRYDKNPEMAICNSYKITSIKEITDILNILEEYEKTYPSNWNRTLESMRNEWIIHNICYILNHKTNRTENVDLDNLDEEKYSHYISILEEIINELNKNEKVKIKIKH